MNNFCVLKFGANWCGPCQSMNPLWKSQQVKTTLQRYKKFKKIDIDRDVVWAKYFKITSVPTVIIAEPIYEDTKLIGYDIYKKRIGYFSNLNTWLSNPFDRIDKQPIERLR